jgi:hypothetical protein
MRQSLDVRDCKLKAWTAHDIDCMPSLTSISSDLICPFELVKLHGLGRLKSFTRVSCTSWDQPFLTDFDFVLAATEAASNVIDALMSCTALAHGPPLHSLMVDELHRRIMQQLGSSASVPISQAEWSSNLQCVASNTLEQSDKLPSVLRECFPSLRQLEVSCHVPLLLEELGLASLGGLEQLSITPGLVNPVDPLVLTPRYPHRLPWGSGLTKLSLRLCRLSLAFMTTIATHMTRLESLELRLGGDATAHNQVCEWFTPREQRSMDLLCGMTSLRSLNLLGAFLRMYPAGETPIDGDSEPANEAVGLRHEQLEELAIDGNWASFSYHYVKLSLVCPQLRMCRVEEAELYLRPVVEDLCTHSPLLESLHLHEGVYGDLQGPLAEYMVEQILDACPLLASLHLLSYSDEGTTGKPRRRSSSKSGSCNLRSLKVQGVRAGEQYSATWSLERSLRRCTRLVSLSLKYCLDLDRTDLTHALTTTSLRILKLKDVDSIGPLDLSSLASRLPRLETLTTELSDEVVQVNACWPNLTSLRLSPLSARVIIRDMPQLAHVKLTSEARASVWVSDCPMLRSLDVTGASRVSFEEGAFGGCPMLTSVTAPGRG